MGRAIEGANPQSNGLAGVIVRFPKSEVEEVDLRENEVIDHQSKLRSRLAGSSREELFIRSPVDLREVELRPLPEKGI